VTALLGVGTRKLFIIKELFCVVMIPLFTEEKEEEEVER